MGEDFLHLRVLEPLAAFTVSFKRQTVSLQIELPIPLFRTSTGTPMRPGKTSRASC
jgi:hypothetical protein